MLGKPTDKQKKIYDTVLKAQTEAIKAIRAGVKAKDIDKVARDIIADEGYGPNFGHALGHGIGIVRNGDRINIHEGPVLSPKSETVLKEGMVCTVEPGIYIPGWGGVRIEDDVVVTKNGCSILNKSPKGLMVL
jgi:Xaa-Pro aminopeptidase